MVTHRYPSAASLRISVAVCSYMRSACLQRCIAALRQQRRSANEIVIILRSSDLASREVVRELAPDAVVGTVDEPGVIAATHLAIAISGGDIIAFTDDDASPQPEWLERIEEVFERDNQIGAVGGRDRLHISDRPDLLDLPVSGRVGTLSATGVAFGYHHCVTKEAEAEVDFLKGVNMALRRVAIGGLTIDTNLRGKGAQPAWEMDLCLQLKKRGYRLVYSREIVVDHYIAPRLENDVRHEFDSEGGQATVFNSAYVVFKHGTFVQRYLALLRNLLRGSRTFPGWVLGILFLLFGDKGAFERSGRVHRLVIDAWNVARNARVANTYDSSCNHSS